MDQGLGQELPGRHAAHKLHPAARVLIVIEAGGTPVARLLLDSGEQVAEFDASTEELGAMTRGLAASLGAAAPQWDKALAGHSAEEREAARVFRLPV
ncbi:hypothetical protein LZ017_12620 [Pelomonas sp. CA6]|uniref:hypothetical protein n=1 Tax=Pelomonas sp. CA6 TaxID=2907999 RepID=UPI001F4C3215|nr:hypothetical protein [Pelomonas sp. CA6]MCH7344219.1 hypothetical protein [Pelomonas sp. CA6]